MHKNKMKAIVYTQYGAPEVLTLGMISKPEPADHEIRVKIHATTVTAADGMMRTGKPWIGRLYLGLRKPKRTVPGVEFAGVVDAIGKAVDAFQLGDQIFGETTALGCYAEYVCTAADGVLAKIPANVSMEQASPICGGAMTAWNFLKGLANIQAGQQVLINGASGSVGSYAVQIAASLGAEVTAVCSGRNAEWVQSLGAQTVIDYTQEDFTQRDQIYDIIFDTVGKLSYSKSKKVLAKKGTFLSTVLNQNVFFNMLWTNLFGSRKIGFSSTGMLPVKKRRAFLKELQQLMAAGKISSFIDRYYPLDQIVEAHRYVDQGRKRGNVVVQVAGFASV